MKKKKAQRRVPLSLKLNLMTGCMIVLVAMVVTQITYNASSEYVRQTNSRLVEQCARFGADSLSQLPVDALVVAANTEAFRRVRAEAEAAGDEAILTDWMSGQAVRSSDADEGALSLHDLYSQCLAVTLQIRESTDMTSVQLQYTRRGVTYDLVDPDAGVMALGVEERIGVDVSQDEDNALILPTMHRAELGLLFTAAQPVLDERTGRAVAQFHVDLDVSWIVTNKNSFMYRAIAFISIMTALCLLLTTVQLRRFATTPIRKLAKATSAFGVREGCTKDDVIQLDIRNNDEIGDLYREIQSMQGRIVDYTDELARVTAEEERVRTELRLAAEIQRSALSSDFPRLPELSLCASMDPARGVGGDFYDFLMLDEDHLALLIADVTGKGIPAALFMMSVKNMIDAQIMLGGTPAQVMTAVNKRIYRNNDTQTFVTVWLGILDIRTGELTCVNAGHEYPMVRGADGRFRLFKDRHGLVAGGMPGTRYRDYALKLNPGDAIFVYTDGVPEAANGEAEQYTTARLEAALNAVPDQRPEAILRTVRDDVEAFVAGAEQFDDLTMLCLEYYGVRVSEDGGEQTQ